MATVRRFGAPLHRAPSGCFKVRGDTVAAGVSQHSHARRSGARGHVRHNVICWHCFYCVTCAAEPLVTHRPQRTSAISSPVLHPNSNGRHMKRYEILKLLTFWPEWWLDRISDVFYAAHTPEASLMKKIHINNYIVSLTTVTAQQQPEGIRIHCYIPFTVWAQ